MIYDNLFSESSIRLQMFRHRRVLSKRRSYLLAYHLFGFVWQSMPQNFEYYLFYLLSESSQFIKMHLFI